MGLFIVIGGISIGLSHAAGTASLNLSPASGSHEAGSTFSVSVYENSSDPVNAVEADFSYDSSQLQFLNIDSSSSAFNTTYPSSGGGGNVKIARANSGGSLTGNQVIANVSFKVLSDNTTATLSFLTSSAIVRSSDTTNVWNGNTTGASYSLTTPTQTPVTNLPPSAAHPPTALPSATPPTPTTSAPSASSAHNTSPNNSGPPVEPSSLDSPAKPTPAASVPQLTQSSENITHYFVAIKIIDKKNLPVEGADVTLGKQTVKSDVTGIAGFVDVPAGSYTAKVHSKLGYATLKVDVDPHVTPTQVQQFQVKFKPTSTVLPYTATAIVFIALLAAVGLGLFRKLAGHFPWGSGPFGPDSSDSPYDGPPTTPQVPAKTAIESVGDGQAVNSTLLKSNSPSPGVVVEPEPTKDSY